MKKIICQCDGCKKKSKINNLWEVMLLSPHYGDKLDLCDECAMKMLKTVTLDKPE